MSNKSEQSSEDNFSNEDSSSSSSEDEEEPDVPFEKDFFKTLSYLKAKDPSIYDSNVKFFDNIESDDTNTTVKKEKHESKPMYLKDFERNLITERKGILSDDEEEQEKKPTYVDLQKNLKADLKRALYDGNDSEEDDKFAGLLKKKHKTSKEKEIEEEDYIQWLKGYKDEVDDESDTKDLKPLHDFWNNPNLDENEEFLRDFILNKRFLDKKECNIDIDDESCLSEDGRAIEDQEKFEQSYNMRFEEEGDLVKRYPRNVEGSLRRKDDRRTKQRAKIRERKQVERQKKREEIKKAQKQKLKEIEERLEELKTLVGNDELGFSKEDILEDFDPEKFDKKMNAVYNDDFYQAGDDVKPEESESVEDKTWYNDESGEYNNEDYIDDNNFENGDFNMDCEADLEEKPKKKETRTKRKKNRKKNAFADIASVVKPVYDPNVHNSFQKYMDEFYGLDCEDFIEDIPCRYKYRTVEPNDYGLSVEEILMAEDKELNKWSSLKKILKKRPSHIEKNEVKVYQQKAKNDNLKRKIIPSLFKEEEAMESEENTEKPNDTQKSENNSGDLGEGTSNMSNQNSKNKNLKLKNKGNRHNFKGSGKGVPQKNLPNQNFKNKVKKFSKQNTEYSDNRLKAYGIKPKKFRRK